MTIEDKIAALLAEAEPLRGLDHDDPKAAPLAGIVDRINELRAIQAKPPQGEILMLLPADDPMVVARRKPGPKPKQKDAE